jgi:catecholate siderophore receptor
MQQEHRGMRKSPSFHRCGLGLPYQPLAAAIAAASFSMPAAYAQQPVIEELTVTGVAGAYGTDQSTSVKYSQRLLDTPKTLTIITEDLLKDRNADSLRDGLRSVAGITLEAGEGGAPPGDSMYIRGFSARNDIMIDGVRDIAGYVRDIYNVESVEIVKGPGSAVYGRGATGGNINLQSKTARLDEFADLSVRGGSEGDYRVMLDLNRGIGETSALRVNLLSDDGDVPGRNEVFNSKNAVAVSLATGIDTRSRFMLNAEYQKQDNLPDYGLPWVPNNSGLDDRTLTPELLGYQGMAPPTSFDNFYGNLGRDFEDIDAQSITARYERDISHSTTLRAQYRAGSVARKNVVTAPRFSFETVNDVRIYGPDVTLSDEKTRDTDDSLNVGQFDLIGSYDLGSIRHDVVTGVEFAQEEFKRYNVVDLVDDNLDSTPVLLDLQNPDPRAPFTGRYGRDGTRQVAEGDTTATYVFDTMTFSPAWQLTLGLRWDRFETEYQYDYADPSLQLATTDREMSWSVGVVYKPSDNSTIYFGTGTSFNPSAEDLTASPNGNDADLEPEESISYELGTKWQLLNGRLFATAALFRTEKDHARTDDPFDDGSIETLNGVQRVDGLEIGAVGQVTDKFSISAAYTLQDSEVVNAEGDDAGLEGFELARTPENSYSLWGRYDFNPKWTAAVGAQYIGERYNSSDPGGRELADSYLVYEMMVAYQANDRFGLRFNGSNLADERYADRVGGGHFAPGEGRAYSLSALISF